MYSSPHPQFLRYVIGKPRDVISESENRQGFLGVTPTQLSIFKEGLGGERVWKENKWNTVYKGHRNNPNKRQGGPWGGQGIYDTWVKTGGVALQDYWSSYGLVIVGK